MEWRVCETSSHQSPLDDSDLFQWKLSPCCHEVMTWLSTSHCHTGDPGTGHTHIRPVAGDLNLKQREEATLYKTQAVTDAVLLWTGNRAQSWPCCWYSRLTVSRDTEQITSDSGYLPAFWIIRPRVGEEGEMISSWGITARMIFYKRCPLLLHLHPSLRVKVWVTQIWCWTTRPSLSASGCAGLRVNIVTSPESPHTHTSHSPGASGTHQG